MTNTYETVMNFVIANDIEAIKKCSIGMLCPGHVVKAAKLGYFEMIRYFDSKKVTFMQRVWNRAVRYRHLNILIWIEQNHPEIINRSTKFYEKISTQDFCNYEMKAWLSKAAPPYNIEDIINKGDIEELKSWYQNERNNDKLYIGQITTLAIKSGHLPILEKLRKWRLPWPINSSSLTEDPAVLAWFKQPRESISAENGLNMEDGNFAGFIVMNL